MGGKRRSRSEDAAHALDRLMQMEPDLRLLQGLLTLLRGLSETSDAIEPVALAALARLCEGPVERMDLCWREAVDACAGVSSPKGLDFSYTASTGHADGCPAPNRMTVMVVSKALCPP